MPKKPTNDSADIRRVSKQRYNLLAPRFWHGMAASTWFKLLSRSRFVVSPSRIPMAAAVSVASCVNSTLGLAENLVYGRKLKEAKVKHPPLFILGHWRAGTTLLHELLVLDKRHTFPNTCQCFAPHHFLLTQGLITNILGFVMPKQRPMDNMETGWRRPQEDEFALCNLGVPSPYIFLADPDRGAVHTDYLTLQNLNEEDRQAWKQAFLAFVEKLSFHDSRRLIMKSPTHTGRVKSILEIFPDAKFVHLSRNPFELFPSTMRLWKSLGYVQSLRVPRHEEWLEEYVLETLTQMYEQFEQDRALLKSSQLVDISYEELAASPKETVRKLYEQLDLGEYETVEPALDEHVRGQKDYKTNKFELPEATRRKIEERWAGYISKYGYGGSVGLEI